MKKILLAITILLCISTTPLYAIEAVFVENAEVSEDVVRLGDIVEFSAETPLVRSLKTKRVGVTPAVGQELSLKRHLILRQLSSEKLLTPDIRWTGAETTTVRVKTVSISSKEIELLISEYLLDKSTQLGDIEFSFTPNELPAPFNLGAGDLETEVVPSKSNIIGSNRFSVVFKMNGRTVKNVSVRGKLQTFAPVFVASQNIARGTPLEESFFVVEKRDINNVKKPYLAQNSLKNIQLSRRLREGDVLTQTQIEQIPLVMRGQNVKVLLYNGSLQIQMTGIARANGGLDEMIRIQNISSNKLFYARVVAPGLVEVRL